MAEATRCEAREDGQHLATFLHGHRVCYWCRRDMDSCCEGQNPDEPDEAFVANTVPASQPLGDLDPSQRPDAAVCGFEVHIGGYASGAVKARCYLYEGHEGEHRLDVFATEFSSEPQLTTSSPRPPR